MENHSIKTEILSPQEILERYDHILTNSEKASLVKLWAERELEKMDFKEISEAFAEVMTLDSLLYKVDENGVKSRITECLKRINTEDSFEIKFVEIINDKIILE